MRAPWAAQESPLHPSRPPCGLSFCHLLQALAQPRSAPLSGEDLQGAAALLGTSEAWCHPIALSKSPQVPGLPSPSPLQLPLAPALSAAAPPSPRPKMQPFSAPGGGCLHSPSLHLHFHSSPSSPPTHIFTSASKAPTPTSPPRMTAGRSRGPSGAKPPWCPVAPNPADHTPLNRSASPP